MVLNINVVAKVVHASAHFWQFIACNPERLSSDVVLHLLFCLPFQRLFRSLSTYLGYRHPHSD